MPSSESEKRIVSLALAPNICRKGWCCTSPNYFSEIWKVGEMRSYGTEEPSCRLCVWVFPWVANLRLSRGHPPWYCKVLWWVTCGCHNWHIFTLVPLKESGVDCCREKNDSSGHLSHNKWCFEIRNESLIFFPVKHFNRFFGLLAGQLPEQVFKSLFATASFQRFIFTCLCKFSSASLSNDVAFTVLSPCTLGMSNDQETMTGTCFSNSECVTKGGSGSGNCASGWHHSPHSNENAS